MMILVMSCPVFSQTFRLGKDASAFVEPQSLVVLAAGLGLAKAVTGWDDRANSHLEENWILEFSDVTNLYGSSRYNLPASLIFWSYTRMRGGETARALSSDIIRSLVYVQAVVGPIKHAVGRERPDGSNKLSFPSGHTANSFAMAELFRGRFGWKAGVPLYTLGVLTALGRMEENLHHLSDVVAGATIGYAIGRAVNGRTHSRINIAPYRQGLAVSTSF